MLQYQLIEYAVSEVTIIRVSIRSERTAVKEFLQELKSILTKDNFNIDNDLLVIKSSKEKMEYSTSFTLIDLEYDIYDISDRLKELTIQEYSQTLIDKDDDKPPLLFVFGKDINDRQIYIKLKIKDEPKHKVLCLSFHYAEYEMNFPYA